MLVQANESSVKIADLSKPSNYSSAGPFFVLPQFLKGYTCKVIRVKCMCNIAQISYLYKI